MQNYEKWELLIVDDHSDDNTFEIIQLYSKRDSRIKGIRNSENGIIAALSLAFENSKGDFITRMDADDLMPSQKLETLLSLCRNNKKIVATGLVKYISQKEISEGYLRYEKWLNDIARSNSFNANMYRECVIASPNWMVHRSCFEDRIQFNNLNYPEDYDLVLKWYKHGYTFAASDIITHLWREHPERTSRNSELYQQKSFFDLKTNFFVTNELKKDDHVQLVGLNQKGKLVAKKFTELGIEFSVYEYNYNGTNPSIMDVSNLAAHAPVVLTNWPVSRNTQKEILSFLEQKKIIPGKNLFLF